jgi:AbrB family looped-hinge helix DNA binding protein
MQHLFVQAVPAWLDHASASGMLTAVSTLVKVQPKGQMTIPRRVRDAVGLVDGDIVEVRAIGTRIGIIPQSAIDRSKFPNTDDEYDPA